MHRRRQEYATSGHMPGSRHGAGLPLALLLARPDHASATRLCQPACSPRIEAAPRSHCHPERALPLPCRWAATCPRRSLSWRRWIACLPASVGRLVPGVLPCLHCFGSMQPRCAHPARCACSLPPSLTLLTKSFTDSRLPPAPRTRAGAQDRICRGESTFAVELLETSSLLAHSTPASLVVRWCCR